MHPTGHGLGAARSWGTTTRCGDKSFRPWSRGRLAGGYAPATRSLIAVWTWEGPQDRHWIRVDHEEALAPPRSRPACLARPSTDVHTRGRLKLEIHVVIQGTLRG